MGLFDFFKKKEYGAVLKEQVTVNTQPQQVPPAPVAAVQQNNVLQTGASSLFRIDDVFTISGRGTIVTGEVLSGTFALNDTVTISETGQQTQITGIEMFRRQCDIAQTGDKVGIVLRGISRDDVHGGFTLINNNKVDTVTVSEKPLASAEFMVKEVVGQSAEGFLVVEAYVIDGSFKINDVVRNNINGQKSNIKKIVMFSKEMDYCEKGDHVTLSLSGMIARKGDRLSKE